MYPPIAIHAHGWLDVGDGHAVYWEQCGNPAGQAALFVHGGPGAGASAEARRWFDPQRYRIVLFDQRGAGRSTPSGCTSANTTAHLVADMELLRQHLGIARWLLLGGSWGATLALAYAQAFPERVSALVLRGVFTATAAESAWLYGSSGAARQHPAAWQRFISTMADGPLLDAYWAALHCGDPAREQAAARAWLQWEQDLMAVESLAPGATATGPTALEVPKLAGQESAAAALAFARIAVHYARHHFFLSEGQLLQQARRLKDIPGVIVQGARDGVTPPAAAAALHRAWPRARYLSIAQAGHASSQPVLAQTLIAATDFFGTLTLPIPPTHYPEAHHEQTTIHHQAHHSASA